MRKSLPLALLLSTSLVTTVLAAPQPTPSAFLRSLAAPATCALALPAPVSQPLPPAPQERTGGGCLQADCSSNLDCPCGNDYGICGINGTCQYSPSGGGGGGSHGCPQADCFLNSECVANCAAGPNSYCGPGNVCVYVR
jgi:hypothetical protein